MDLIALAAAPGIAICLFIFHRDAYNREPKMNLLITFLLGAASVITAFFIERELIDETQKSIVSMAVRAFLMVALVEEAGKFAALRLYAYPRKSFDEPLDGIVYAVMASMGFATAENILYVWGANQPGSQTNPYQLAVMRMLLAVPAHATFGVVMGYFAGKAKFNPAKSASLLLTGFFWAVFFHGAYDFFLFLQESPDIVDHQTADGLLFLGAVVSLIVALVLSFKHIKVHRHLSQRTYKPTEKLTMRKASPTDIPLIRNLTDKIWPVTYAAILPKEQIDYMMKLMYSEEALQKDMKNNIDYLMISDSKVPVGFAAYGWTSPGICKLYKIYFLRQLQGKGLGAFTIDQIIKTLKTAGGTALQLNVNRQNNAKDFYEKMGFAVIKEEDIDIGGGYAMNDYVMEKKI